MFDYLFPIFCFGVAVTGIVVKGLVMAADMAAAEKKSADDVNVESDGQPIPARSASVSSFSPIGPGRHRSGGSPRFSHYR